MPIKTKSTHVSTFFLLVLFCFFFSGVAGLIYQILWLRMIDKVIGSAPFAVATVLSVFMGGLALGSWLAGKYIDRVGLRSDLLSLYGKAELAIGIYGLLLPLLIYAVKPIYVLAYNVLFVHFWLYRIFTFLGSSFLLIVPTTLMGITLPVLCRFYVENLGHIGARTGRLYGINTIGGAAGAALCGFFLIANFGVWGSLATAVGINVIIGVLCIVMARGQRHIVSEPMEKAAGESKATRVHHKEPGHTGFMPVDDRVIVMLSLWIFGISGFCSMAYEVFWTRLLGLIIGPTTYSFSLVVSTFIVGLALGNIIFGRLADRVKDSFRLLVITQVCAACLALLVSQFLGNSQFFFSKLIYTFQADFGEKMLVQSVVLFFVLVGPTIFLGAAFPLVNRIYARSLPEIGKTVGTAYAMNTIGAILGSFVAGFILIPLLGKENGLRITAGLQVFTSLIALACIILRSEERIRASVTGLITLSLGLLLLINFPSWNHNILYKGWYRQYTSFEKYFTTTSWFDALWKGPSKIAEHVANIDVVFYGDGIGGFTTVVKWFSTTGTANYTLFNSGKTEANSRSSRLVQSLSAHIPILFHPDPEKVMILGLASGMTAGETLLYPVRQLDVLEINDQVIKAAEFFNPYNNNCLTNPKARIIVQDGRNHLELTNEKYDVIISSPSDPWMAGLSNLFTLEYFETVKKRLKENGFFAQWISAYDMDWDSFAMIGRTFAKVFPESLLIKTNSSSGDLFLVGFSEKKTLDLKTADKNIVYAKQSKNITIRDPRVIFNLIVTEDLKEFFGPGPFHTDNWPHLEFAAPKNIDTNDNSIADKINNNRLLSKETKEIVESNKDIDASLDNLEMMVAVSGPPFNDIDLNKATAPQIKRYQDILKYYCSDEDVFTYSIFPNSDFQRQCAQVQIDRMQAHLVSGSEDSQDYYRLALAFKVTGNMREEIEALQKAIYMNPSYYEAYLELGQVYILQKRLDEAFVQFSEALKINPGYAEVHNNIGNVLALQGKTSEAVSYYSRALQLNPDFVDAYNNLANVLISQGNAEEAVKYYSRALQIKPDSATMHDNLGLVFAGQGRFEDALSQIYEALKIDPNNADFHKDAGIVLGQQGELSKAVDHFREAIRLNPNHFLAHKNLGVTLFKQGNVRDAFDHFSKASEIRPDDPEVHKMLGMILESQGRFKEAAGHYLEALKFDPDSAENHDNLGVALAQMGQLEDAIKHFNKALEIDSSFKTARDHLKIALSEIEK